MRRLLLKALVAILLLAAVLAVGLSVPAPVAAAVDGDVDGRRDLRRRSRSSATPTPSRTSSRHQGSTRCTASATCTPRIGCGRWSFSGASATAGCPRSSAPRRSRRIGFCAPSASAAPRAARGRRTPAWAQRRSTPTSPASTRSSPRITAAACRRSSRCCASSRSHGRGLDVIVWVKMMAWDLSANYAFELLRHDLVGARRRGADGASCCRPTRLTGSQHPAGRRCARVRRSRRVRPVAARPRTELDRASPRRRDYPTAARSWSDAFAPRSLGRHRVRDLLLGGARARALGSNNWVVDGTLTASGKPLLANDPHLGTRRALARGIWRTSSAGDFESSARRFPARRRWRSAATGTSPGARPTSPPTSRICIANGSTRRGHAAPSSAARRSRSRSSRKRSRVKGAEPVARRRPRHPARPARLGRDQREQRGVDDRAEAGAARAARVPLDGARRRGLDGRVVSAAQRGAQLERVHRGAARLRRRRRRISSTPTSTATSATTRRANPDPRVAATARLPAEGWTRRAPNGPAGFRSTSCRTSTIRRSTSSSRRITGRRRRRIRTCSGSSGPSRTARSGFTNCSRAPATRRIAADRADAGRLRADPGGHASRCTRRRCCRCSWRTRVRTGAGAAAGGRRAAQWNFERRARQRGGGDLRRLVPPARAGPRRRRARAAPGRALSRAASRSSRASSPHTLTANDSAWCDDVTTGARDLRRRGHDGAA